MEKEYIISGTPEELTKILKSEFSLSDDESRFFITVLLSPNEETTSIERTDLSMWFLENAPEHRTAIFNTRHSISLTDFKISFLKKLFIVGGVYLAEQEKVGVAFVLDCIVSLFESHSYIEDSECCVYFLALNWKRHHKSQLIHPRNIIEQIQSNICINLDKHWNCPYLRGESCNLTETLTNDILVALCTKNVLIQKSDLFDFKI
jgi:hypothetical protein